MTIIDKLIAEVLRLDGEATPGPWRWRNRRHEGDPTGDDDELVGAEQDSRVLTDGSAGGEYGADIDVFGPDAALITSYRTAAPLLAAEVRRLRAAVVFADQQGAEAIDRMSKSLIADKWNSTVEWQNRALAAEAKLEQVAADEETALAELRRARDEIVSLTADLREHNAVQVRALAFLKGLVAFPDAEQVPDPELPEEVKEVLVGIGDLVREQHSTVARLSGGMVPLNGVARACSPDIEVEIRQLRAETADLRQTIEHYRDALRTPLGTDTGPNGVRELQQGIDQLEAERDELRLTLAAEQGKQEGAPSEGWVYEGRDWSKTYPDGSFAGLSGSRGKRRWMRALWPDTTKSPRYLGRGFDVETDRAAMLAADAATP